MFAALLVKCFVSYEYGEIIFGADLPFYATDSGRRRSYELETVLPIYMQIEREDC
jgi:hypothetical protein